MTTETQSSMTPAEHAAFIRNKLQIISGWAALTLAYEPPRAEERRRAERTMALCDDIAEALVAMQEKGGV